jgi:hypothetical protein
LVSSATQVTFDDNTALCRSCTYKRKSTSRRIEP